MTLIEDLASKARNKYPRILLPESTDLRIIEATKSISAQKLAQIIQNKENISNHLNGPSCHATFQRLN